MKRGSRFDQAGVTFSEPCVEQLEALPSATAERVLSDIVALCANPGGKHPLGKSLAGFNTVEVNGRKMRCVYRATSGTEVETGSIEVLCIGQRRDNEVYDTARALLDAGLITADEAAQIWEAFDLLDIAAERAGLDGWDYRPEPAGEGLLKAAVAAGITDEATARLLSRQELIAALEAADQPDPVQVALDSQRRVGPRLAPEALVSRGTPRCAKWMPRARSKCARKKDHPGPCRRS